MPGKVLSHKKAEVNQQFRVFTKQEAVCLYRILMMILLENPTVFNVS